MNLLVLTFLLLAPLSWAAQNMDSLIKTIGEKLIKETKSVRPYGNLLIYPWALVESAALLYNGANGNTASKIAKAFDFPSDTETNFQVQTLKPELRDLEGGSQFVTVVHKINVLNEFQVNERFNLLAERIYSTDVYNIELNEGLESLSIINRCIAEETRDLIEDVFAYDSLKRNTTFVSTVGWFFQGPWALPFDRSQTSQVNFYVDGRKPVPVETMTLQATLNYAENTRLGVKYVELPFAGNAASLVIVLPIEQDGLDKIVQKIERTDNPSFQKQTVKLSLPKFQVKARWNSKKLIQQVTGDLTFGDAGDDFSNIAGKKGDIKLDVLTQVGYIRINEAGILVPPIPKGVKVPKPPQASGANVKEFKVDHPFLFRIVRSSAASDVILSRGLVRDPTYPLASYILN